MPKLDWFPFDTKEYLGWTMHFDTKCHGAMILFLMRYWETGCVPDTDEGRRELAGVGLDDWDYVKWTIAGDRSTSKEGEPRPFLFQADWTNPYMDAIRARCEGQYRAKIERYQALDARRPAPADWMVIRARIFERDDFTCTYCGTRGGELECDHMIPIAQGGSNEDDNLTTACLPCNRSKGPRTVEQWRTAA